MIYHVTAQAHDPKTGRPTGPERVEAIDTETNVLFRRCRNPHMVREYYECFWNGDAAEERPFPGSEVVWVSAVVPARD